MLQKLIRQFSCHLLALGILIIGLTGCLGQSTFLDGEEFAKDHNIDFERIEETGQNHSQRSAPLLDRLKDERHLVINYTAGKTIEHAKAAFTSGEVSLHYVIDEQGNLYQFVDEKLKAHHAGVSEWRNLPNINDSSIGIAFVSAGHNGGNEEVGLGTKDVLKPQGSAETWCKPTEEAMHTLGLVCKQLQTEYNIPPQNVIGHGDIAVTKEDQSGYHYLGRKVGPGAGFNWEYLHKKYGVGAWYENDLTPYQKVINSLERDTPEQTQEARKAWFQENLLKFGYCYHAEITNPEKNQYAIVRFKLHFRHDAMSKESSISKELDDETIKILASLVNKYCPE